MSAAPHSHVLADAACCSARRLFDTDISDASRSHSLSSPPRAAAADADWVRPGPTLELKDKVRIWILGQIIRGKGTDLFCHKLVAWITRLQVLLPRKSRREQGWRLLSLKCQFLSKRLGGWKRPDKDLCNLLGKNLLRTSFLETESVPWNGTKWRKREMNEWRVHMWDNAAISPYSPPSVLFPFFAALSSQSDLASYFDFHRCRSERNAWQIFAPSDQIANITLIDLRFFHTTWRLAQ